MEFPRLPDVPESLPVTHGLVRDLNLLKLDDDFLTLDLYVGASEIRIVEAMVELERRIAGTGSPPNPER